MSRDVWQEALLSGKHNKSHAECDSKWVGRYLEICRTIPVKEQAQASHTSVHRDWNDEFQRLLQITTPGSARVLMLEKLVEELAVAGTSVVEAVVMNKFPERADVHTPLTTKCTGFLSGTFSCGNLVFHLPGEPGVVSKIVRHASYVMSVAEFSAEVTTVPCAYICAGGHQVLVAAKIPVEAQLGTAPGVEHVVERMLSKMNVEQTEADLRQMYYGKDHRAYLMPTTSMLACRAELLLRFPVQFPASDAESLAIDELCTHLLGEKVASCASLRETFRRFGVRMGEMGRVLTLLEDNERSAGVCELLHAEMLARTLRQVYSVLCVKTDSDSDPVAECVALLDAVKSSAIREAELAPLVALKFGASVDLSCCTEALISNALKRFIHLSGFMINKSDIPFPTAIMISSVMSSRVGLDFLSQQGTSYPVARVTSQAPESVLLQVRHSELRQAVSSGGHVWKPDANLIETCIRQPIDNVFTLGFLLETAAKASPTVDLDAMDEAIVKMSADMSNDHERLIVVRTMFRKVLSMHVKDAEQDILSAVALLRSALHTKDVPLMLVLLFGSVLFPEESMTRLEHALQNYCQRNAKKRKGRGKTPVCASPVSLCSEPTPQRASATAPIKSRNRQLVPLANPPGGTTKQLPLVTSHFSEVRGERGHDMKLNAKIAERDYKWWLSKHRLLENKLDYFKRLSERRNEASEKRQLVIEQQQALSKQLDMNNDLAKQNLKQKQDYIRTVRAGQREAVRESRQRLLGKRNGSRTACAEATEANRVMKESFSLMERKEKIESANQVKMQRIVASQERTNRQIATSALSSSIFDERIQNSLLQQCHYEEETYKLVSRSSELLKQMKEV